MPHVFCCTSAFCCSFLFCFLTVFFSLFARGANGKLRKNRRISTVKTMSDGLDEWMNGWMNERKRDGMEEWMDG